MARIFPIQAYRYTKEAGPLEKLVSQPYDKITPEMQAHYLAANPYNVVRLVLGERTERDTNEDNFYTRAAATFNAWVNSGILARDPEPSLFVYSQEFTVPDTGERVMRRGFLGLGAVEDYSEGIVHRHEQTLTGPKEDRMQLLQHTHAQFEQIFMLYQDPGGEIDRILDSAAAGEPAMQVTDDYQVVNRLWRITDTETIERIQEAMKHKKLLIADGHHRYETAVAFLRENPQIEGARRVPMVFVNMHSKGLKILATHRVVYGLRQLDSQLFLGRAKDVYDVTSLAGVEDVKRAFAEEHAALVRMGVALPDGIYLFETARRPGLLDVRLLHQGILETLLGIGEADIREERHVQYVRGMDEAVGQVRSGAAQAAFLLEPASMEDVARIAFEGGVMPQKSTDFYPKLLSGLAIYKMD